MRFGFGHHRLLRTRLALVAPLIGATVAKNGDIGVADRSMVWNSDLVEALEYDNLIAQAVVT
ncbi:MAG: hypothetical protein LW847_15010, partial [Burkholderiales bacterium]|nr:hypothetical protein [Burkholderiales bacterium]